MLTVSIYMGFSFKLFALTVFQCALSKATFLLRKTVELTCTNKQNTFHIKIPRKYTEDNCYKMTACGKVPGIRAHKANMYAYFLLFSHRHRQS